MLVALHRSSIESFIINRVSPTSTPKIDECTNSRAVLQFFCSCIRFGGLDFSAHLSSVIFSRILEITCILCEGAFLWNVGCPATPLTSAAVCTQGQVHGRKSNLQVFYHYNDATSFLTRSFDTLVSLYSKMAVIKIAANWRNQPSPFWYECVCVLYIVKATCWINVL